MSAIPAPRPSPSLYERLIDLPAHQVGEIIHGRLYAHPRPAARHARAHSALNIRIGGPFWFGSEGGPGGWWILTEPEIHFVRDTEVVVPDIGGWRRERLPSLPDGHRFEVVPDWVCEVLSPGTTRVDRAIKLPLYARYGVAHAWLVDPQERTLEVYALQGERWLLWSTFKEADAVSAPPFEAIRLPLGDLWG
jgi:Uma2 family endonuclease